MPDTERRFTDEQVDEFLESLNNWGRWGDDDELGTLNLVTPEKRVEAAQLVEHGVSVSLAHDLNVHQSSYNPRPAIHIMQYMGENAPGAVDFLGLQCHGLATTHVNALCHVFLDGKIYNGYTIEESFRISGARKCAVDNMRDGIVTRGVLLDIPRALGRDWLDANERVHVEDLELVEERQNVRVGSGDALIVRVGQWPRMEKEGFGNVLDRQALVRSGLDADCLPWIHERGVAVYSGDCLDASPHGYPRQPLHGIGIVYMGLCMVDNMAVEELGALCAELNRWEFFLTFAPLRLRHGTGTALNPLAIF